MSYIFNVLLLFTVKHMSVHSIPLIYQFVKAVKKEVPTWLCYIVLDFYPIHNLKKMPFDL